MIWTISATATSPAKRTFLKNTDYLISSFGEDEAGELYVDHRGAIYRIIGYTK